MPPVKVLIAGSGPAAIEAALALRAFGGIRLEVELLTPSDVYVHRPVSVTVPFSTARDRAYSLEAVRELGIRVRKGTLAAVDAADRRVRTGDGERLRYDELIVATGAGAHPWVRAAVTFCGRAGDVEAVRAIVRDRAARVAYVAPRGAGWTLPLYELALQHAAQAAAELAVFTFEQDPLQVFGPTVARALREGLAASGIGLATGAVTGHFDYVIALPVVQGRRIPGLPMDAEGFLPVDEHSRVRGLEHVYAAGDGTDNPVKQGGLATQQARAAAEAIAVAHGFRDAATPYEGVLRALLITGGRPLYLRRRLREPDGEISMRALWWPPGKIAGHRLAAFVDSLDADESVERSLDRGDVRRRVAVLGR